MLFSLGLMHISGFGASQFIYRFGGAVSDGSETGWLTSLSPCLSFLAQADWSLVGGRVVELERGSISPSSPLIAAMARSHEFRSFPTGSLLKPIILLADELVELLREPGTARLGLDEGVDGSCPRSAGKLEVVPAEAVRGVEALKQLGLDERVSEGVCEVVGCSR